MSDSDWDLRDQATARGRRGYFRRQARNVAANERIADQRAEIASRKQPPRPPRPMNFGNRPKPKVDVVVTEVKKLDIQVDAPEVYAIRPYYELPVHTSGFQRLCFEIFRGFGQDLTQNFTREEFSICMNYLLYLKFSKLQRELGKITRWMSVLEATLNISTLRVPALVARYLDCVGIFDTRSGVRICPVIDVEHDVFDGWPIVNSYQDRCEVRNQIVPLSLAGFHAPYPPDADGQPILYQAQNVLDIPHIMDLPRYLAFSTELLSKWITLSGRLEKRVSMSEVRMTIEGNPACLVSREIHGDFVTPFCPEQIDPVLMKIGGIFGFHERQFGMIKEARSLVWHGHFTSCSFSVGASIAALNRKPP